VIFLCSLSHKNVLCNCAPFQVPLPHKRALLQVLLRLELGLQAEQELAALEVEGLKEVDIQNLILSEACRSCSLPFLAGQLSSLPARPLFDDHCGQCSPRQHQLPQQAEAALGERPQQKDPSVLPASLSPNDIRHTLLATTHAETTRLLVFAALSLFDIHCSSLSGLSVGPSAPCSHQLFCSSDSPCDEARSLAQILGLSFSTASVSDLSSSPIGGTSFENLLSGSDSRVPWFARSEGRFRFVRCTLLQMLAPGNPFSGDPGVIRALFRVEGECICQTRDEPLTDQAPEVTQESGDAAAKRARCTAKRWLQEPVFASSLVAWSAFAALEEAAGRHKQAVQVVHTAMAAVSSASQLQRHARWTLALQATLLEFRGTGFQWSSGMLNNRSAGVWILLMFGSSPGSLASKAPWRWIVDVDVDNRSSCRGLRTAQLLPIVLRVHRCSGNRCLAMLGRLGCWVFFYHCVQFFPS
jgi:hypothetical protein